MESGSEETEWAAETYSLGAVRSDVGLTRAVIPSVTTNRDDARYKLWFWKVNSLFHRPHFIEGVVADEG
jgi:hypothetical protein